MERLLNSGSRFFCLALVTRSRSRYNHDVTATLKVEPVVLEGKFVRLEPLTLAHSEDLAGAAADGELWNTDVTIIPKPEGMKDYIQAALKGFGLGFELPFAIVRKTDSTPKVVGTTRFYEIFSNDRRAAIGYTWLSKSAQRTPVNTEAKLLLLTHAFETWGCVRVELLTDVLNDQSRAAILRLGAKQEGILRKHLILPSGRIRDSVVFSIIDSEWPDVKRRLSDRLALSAVNVQALTL
jgi:RimJ/RimL family protein N-acetyltransferase